MKSKIIGYVVISSRGVHHAAPEHKGDKPTLWVGSYATLFATRKLAERTLHRTFQLMAKRNYIWPWYSEAIIKAVKAL